MTDEQKREKVIKGLAACMPQTKEDAEIGCDGCPYNGNPCGGNYQDNDHVNLPITMIEDIRAMLKAQEPRVMTLEEVQISDSPIWIEGGLAGGTWGMMPKTLETIIEFVANGVYTLYPGFAIAEYGVSWRCWTSRPDEKTREGTPWN